MSELDNFLEEGAIPAEVTTEPAEPEGPPRDEHGRFLPKQTGEEQPRETAEPVPPTEPKDQLPPETCKGLKEEREERQNLERAPEPRKQPIQTIQAPAQQQPVPPPSVWEDEQAFGQHLTGQAVNQATFNARLDMSEMLASQAHEYFDEMKEKFIEMM